MHSRQVTNKLYGDLSRSQERFSVSEQTWTLVHLNSLEARQGDTPSSFQCQLSSPLAIDTASLIGFSCSQSIANIRDQFVLDEQGQPLVTGQMPLGYYTQSNFATEVGNYLTSISPGGLTYTVTFNPLNRQVSITSTGNWRFLTPDSRNSFYYGIGWNSVTGLMPMVYALVQNSPGVLDLQPVRGNLFVLIEEFSSYSVNGGNGPARYTFSIEGNSISGGYTFHSSGSQNTQVYKDSSTQRYQNLTVKIYLPNGQLAPFIGGHSTITMSVQSRK